MCGGLAGSLRSPSRGSCACGANLYTLKRGGRDARYLGQDMADAVDEESSTRPATSGLTGADRMSCLRRILFPVTGRVFF